MSSWHTLPTIAVGAKTLNVGEVAAIDTHRLRPADWCTVHLLAGGSIDLAISADELRRRIKAIEEETPVPPGRADVQVQVLTEELRGLAARVRVLAERVHRIEDQLAVTR